MNWFLTFFNASQHKSYLKNLLRSIINVFTFEIDASSPEIMILLTMVFVGGLLACSIGLMVSSKKNSSTGIATFRAGIKGCVIAIVTSMIAYSIWSAVVSS
ncbi:hypothetical protein [Mycoplasma sp. HU2014]|uniref:hypothetical protein n=1 Tax=Mycoplasma sp. HU2014 TaxID=1664275 RepID=UPI00067C3755|nr:hypothetical protein [Mycoplasma sp. HU2014]KNG79784.1 hypothetical protein AB668_02230 [Mycoplasma sp. HU2014]